MHATQQSRGSAGAAQQRPEDGMLAVIADLETRLNSLREGQSERTELATELTRNAGELAAGRNRLSGLEATIANREQSLSERFRKLQAEKVTLRDERKRIERRLSMLDAPSETTDERTRRSLLRQRAELEQREADLARREDETGERQERLETERSSLERDRGELAEQRRKLNEQAAAQEARSDRLEALERDLEKRDEEAKARLAEYEKMKSELGEMSGKLADAVARAESASSEVEKAREAGEARERKLAHERDQIEAELASARRELRELSETGTGGTAIAKREQLQSKRRRVREQPAPQPEFAPESAPARSVVAQADSRVQVRGPLSVLVWMMAVAATATGAVAGLSTGSMQIASGVAGVALGLGIAGSLVIARRAFDPGAWPFVAVALTAGLWAPGWAEAVINAMLAWELPASGIPAWLLANAPAAAVTLSLGFALSVGVLIVTGSGGVFGQAIFATFAATVLAAMPDDTGATLIGAPVLWMAIVLGSLGRWSLGIAREAGRTYAPIASRNQGVGSNGRPAW